MSEPYAASHTAKCSDLYSPILFVPFRVRDIRIPPHTCASLLALATCLHETSKIISNSNCWEAIDSKTLQTLKSSRRPHALLALYAVTIHDNTFPELVSSKNGKSYSLINDFATIVAIPISSGGPALKFRIITFIPFIAVRCNTRCKIIM